MKLKLKRLWAWIAHPIATYKLHKRANQRIKKLKEQDPFIYD